MINPSGNPEDDIGEILARWSGLGRGEIVRFLRTNEGGRRIQVRLALGIVQMECRGRPDGVRPGGHESEYLAVRDMPRVSESWGDDFCQRLLAEAGQYQQRALAYLALEEHALAALDCTRNVEVAGAMLALADATVDRTQLEVLRCASLLLRTRVLAAAALSSKNPAAALKAIDQGLAALGVVTEPGGHRWDLTSDALALRALRDTLVPKLPSSQRVELEERLVRALQLENYELAAILKNELRQIG